MHAGATGVLVDRPPGPLRAQASGERRRRRFRRSAQHFGGIDTGAARYRRCSRLVCLARLPLARGCLWRCCFWFFDCLLFAHGASMTVDQFQHFSDMLAAMSTVWLSALAISGATSHDRPVACVGHLRWPCVGRLSRRHHLAKSVGCPRACGHGRAP